MRCLSVETLRDYLGEPAAEALAASFGGCDLKVPKKAEGGVYTEIARAVGDDVAAVLVANFGGEAMYIAINRQRLLEERREKIRVLRAQGLSFREIARTLPPNVSRVSERWVRKIAAEAGMARPEKGRGAVDTFTVPLFPVDAVPGD